MIDHLHDQLGTETITQLVAAFYRQIPNDEILGPMYDNADLAGAETRLRDFLVFRLGGPQTYLETRGHPALRMRHAPFAVTQAARDRWMKLMTNALEDAIDDDELRKPLYTFLDHVATFLVNR